MAGSRFCWLFHVIGVSNKINVWSQLRKLNKIYLGMQLAEERMLTIPADEGYGAAGFPAWGIPAGGTLQFTLEVLSIK